MPKKRALQMLNKYLLTEHTMKMRLKTNTGNITKMSTAVIKMGNWGPFETIRRHSWALTSPFSLYPPVEQEAPEKLPLSPTLGSLVTRGHSYWGKLSPPS